MILTGLWLFSVGFLVLRMGVAWANVFSRPVLKQPSPAVPFPEKVAVLIPARNEAASLPRLLASLSALPSPALSVRVLDDHSSDGTPDIVRAFAAHDPRIRLLAGAPLPEDWLGKNWACHQLAEDALRDHPDFLLLLDADVAEVSPALIPALYQQSRALDTALISVFPGQEMHTPGEWLTVPLMHYLLLSLLPLWLVRYARFPSMAAANGQCMWFNARVYQEQQWHRQVKSVVIEDIAIMRRVKETGLKGMVFCGGTLIRTRMYDGLRSGINGFSKNLLAGFGGQPAGLVVWLLLLLLPFALFGVTFLSATHNILIITILTIATLSIRAAVSLVAGQPVWKNIALHPFQMGILGVIAGVSIVRTYTGKQEWKGRLIGKSRG